MNKAKMIRTTFAIATICLGFASWCSPALAAHRKAAALLPILESLDNAKVSGSIETDGRCDLRDFPDLPNVRRTDSNGDSTLVKVQALLAENPAIRVTQSSDGTIRIKEARVQADILNVKIRHISFQVEMAGEHDPLYNPNDALRVILAAPEVSAFMKSHHMAEPSGGQAVRGNSGRWPKSLPHISGSLDNVRLSEALDRVLQTFPGLWLYVNCPRRSGKDHIVYFRFFYLRRIGNGAPFVEE